MSKHLRLLSRSDYPGVYEMMLSQDFPDTPECLEEAIEFFDETKLYGAFENEKLYFVFILGAFIDDGAFLDIICKPGYEGKWATKRLVKQLLSTAFDDMSLSYLWVQARRGESLKAALKAGFVFAGEQNSYEPVLVLTKNKAKYYVKWAERSST